MYIWMKRQSWQFGFFFIFSPNISPARFFSHLVGKQQTKRDTAAAVAPTHGTKHDEHPAARLVQARCGVMQGKAS